MARRVPAAFPRPGDRRSRRLLAGLLLAVITSLFVLGAVYLVYEIRQLRAEAGAQLAAVAELKAAQIEDWLHERRADASVLGGTPFLLDDSGHLADPGAAGTGPAKLTAYLERFRTDYGYSSVALFDSDLRVVLEVPPGSAPADAASTKLLPAARKANGVVTGELVRAGSGKAFLDFVAPVLPAGGTSFAGAVRLRVDAGARLFPLLSTWPSPSDTAESLLFRREGDSLVYLSPLRHRPGAVEGLRLPLHRPSLLAAAAVLDPRADPIEGDTYRGVRGLAVARPVAGTPWKLIAQVDLDEAYRPAREEALRLAVGLALVLVLALLAVSLLWRTRHFDLLRREREAERVRLETAERLALVLQHANDAILLMGDDLRLIEANDRASVLYGYAPDELPGLSISDLRAPESRASFASDLAITRQSGGRIFETVHCRRDGTTFPVEVSSRPVEIAGRPYLLSLVRDISERKEHERQLERLNRMYLALSRVGEAIVQATDDAELAGSVCRILVEAGGFTLAWIGRLDPSGAIVPQAQAGDDAGYVEGIRVSVDDTPEGHGPAGTAFREGRPVVANDFLSDPRTLPWRDRAERSGLHSTIALPLYRLGAATGALMIYAGEKDYFGRAEIALAEEVARNLSFAFDVLAWDLDRRAAEQALRAREEIFSSIVGQAIDAIALVDAETGRFVEFNEAAHRSLGYSREEFAGLSIGAIQAEHSQDEIRRNVGRVLEYGSEAFETRHRHRSGEIRSVHVRARLLTLQERPYIAAVWTDITERKRAELQRQQTQEALRENEARLSEAQRIAHIGVWELDHQRDRRIWSDEMYRIFGAAPHSLPVTFETFLGFIHPEDRERAIQANTFSLTNRVPYEIDYRLLLKDGGVKHVHERCETWFDEAGTPLRSVGTVQDVTAHQQAEARLRKLSSAVEQSPAAIVITDLSGAMEYVNPRFTEVTGYTLEEVRGRNPRVLKSGKTPPEVYAELWRTITGGEVWRGEITNRKKSGELFDELVVIAPVNDAMGRPTHYVAMKEDVTDRRRAEEELRKLSSAIEQSPVSIVITDLTGAIEYANPYFSQVTGYELAQVRGQNPRVLKSGETPAGIYADMWRTLVAGKVWRGELHNRKKNGETFLEQAVIAPIAGPNGRVTHYVAIKEDITERKRSDDALRESESRFRRLFEAAPVPLCVVQGPTGKMVLNEKFVETFGYTADDLTTIDDWWLRAYPDASGRAATRGTWEVALGTALARGSDIPPMQVRVTCRNGEERMILISGAPLGTGLLVSLFDVTEREAAEAALLAKQARLQEAQALALLGSWERDLRSGTLVRSPEIHGIFERDASTFGTSADDFFEAVHPEDREWVQKAYAESFQSTAPREIDHRIVVADGRVKWVRARWRSELGPDGTPARAAGTIQDITDHVLAREARSLAEAKEVAESANRAKSAFLASMSHEIRTPMNAILGFSQLLLGDTGLTDRHREQLQAISRSGEHLLGLIDDVLEMSKIEAGRVTVNPAECDLLDLLWDLESMFRVRAHERGLDVSVDRGAELPRHVVTDERKLRQILINLMGNAVKFTATGGLTVRVWAQPASGSHLQLHVEVADTGPGISDEELPRLFQRFEQTRSGRESSSGTGLGLAISRGFARLMGGDISVRSRLGEGSVFRLSLPVTLSASHAAAEKVEPRRVAALAADESRRRILVADDVEENREILRQMLGRVGFVVRTAIDGRQTLELFSAWHPDLVLMDLRMPGMDGLEATRSIRAAERTGRTPIIAVTASAFEEDRRQVEEAGGDDFVSKPFREMELLQKVGRCLGVRYVSEDEAAAPGAPAEPEPRGAPSVPEPLRTALRTAVVNADLERVGMLADELARIDPGAAGSVRDLAERFEYDQLLALLEPGVGSVP